jgi:hypothetical protein
MEQRYSSTLSLTSTQFFQMFVIFQNISRVSFNSSVRFIYRPHDGSIIDMKHINKIVLLTATLAVMYTYECVSRKECLTISNNNTNRDFGLESYAIDTFMCAQNALNYIFMQGTN